MMPSNDLPDNFKETEIGPIPVDWEVATIGDLVDEEALRLQNGFPCGNHNQEGRGIPHLRPFNVDEEGDVSLDTIKYIETDRDLEKYFLALGDVLFNNTNSEELVGKTAYWDRAGRYVLSNHMTILRVLDNTVVNSFYLAKYLHKRWYDGFYRGLCRRHVNQASISLTRLKGIPIALPPLPEQRRIAHVLSTIQRAIAAQDDLIAAAREVKRSLMQRLFTYGPGPEPAPTKETEIGEIPEHWEVTQLGDHITEGPQNGLYKPLSLYGEGTPIIRIDDYDTDGRFTSLNFRRVRLEPKEVEKYVLREQDILVNRVNSLPQLGKSILIPTLPEPTVFESNMMRFAVDGIKLSPQYAILFLCSPQAHTQMVCKAKRAVAQSSINQGDVKSLLVPLPLASEQTTIVRIAAASDRKIEAEGQRKAALQVFFKTMLHQLMTGQLRLRKSER